MDEFVYTDMQEFDSSAVEYAAYNSNTEELVVVLTSGQGYLYSKVPHLEWSMLKGSVSAGRYYATKIKRNYGPGTNIGWFYNAAEEDDFFKHGYQAPSMEAVVGNSEGPHLTITAGDNQISGDGSATFPEIAQPAVLAAKSEPVTLSIVDAPEPGNNRLHTVVFESGGVERQYSLSASSVDEAVAAVYEIADVLDLDFIVREVRVTIE